MPKNIRLNSTHYFVMKIPNKIELQQIALNHLSDIDFQDFMNLYKKCTENHILFWLLILLLYQIILYVLERIFKKEYKSYSRQLMMKLKMKNYNTIITGKQQKYQHYRKVKLIIMNIFQGKKYCHLIKVE